MNINIIQCTPHSTINKNHAIITQHVKPLKAKFWKQPGIISGGGVLGHTIKYQVMYFDP